MASGLRIWDASGNLLIDTATRLPRILGYANVSANGSLTNAGFQTGTAFVMVRNSTAFADGFYAVLPKASISGSTLTWTYPDGFTPQAAQLIYGVY